MKKLLLLLISFLGIFSACEREPVTPVPGDGPDTLVHPMYGIRTAVYEPKAAVEEESPKELLANIHIESKE